LSIGHGGARARVLGQVPGEAADALGGLADPQDALDVRRVLRLLPEEIGVRDDRGERVVELVDDARHHLPERAEPLELDHLLAEVADLLRLAALVGAARPDHGPEHLRQAMDEEAGRALLEEARPVVGGHVERRAGMAGDRERGLELELWEEAPRVDLAHLARRVRAAHDEQAAVAVGDADADGRVFEDLSRHREQVARRLLERRGQVHRAVRDDEAIEPVRRDGARQGDPLGAGHVRRRVRHVGLVL
jgi:hypothetical protein